MENAAKQLLMLRLGIQFTIALLLSLVMTLINYGIQGEFLQHWAKAFVVAFVVIPVALRLIPIVAKNVGRLLGYGNPLLLRSVVAVCVAVTMEATISFAVTLAQHGFSAGWSLLWANTFLKALPVGLMIGVTMTFFVQPRMQKLAAAAHPQ